MQPPLHSPTVARPLLSSSYCVRVNLVGCCMHSLIGGRLKPQRILFIYYFALKSDGQRCLSHIYPTDAVSFRLVVASSQAAGAIEIQVPAALSILFFSSLHLPPETMGKRPPPIIPPIRISSPSPLTPPTPLFSWLLCQTIEQRPFKTGAPPMSQFFDRSHIGAPNKGTKRSAHAPSRRPPPSGSWGAAAMRFGSMAGVAMEREGEAAGR
jgi:hypothetical protein